MAQQVLGQMADSGSSLVLEGNALKTQDSIIALSNITRIQCVDDTIPHKLNVVLLVILVIVGAGLITAGEVISILLGLACFGGVAYLIYDHTQKQKQRTYALVIELSAGTREAFHSDDLNFLNGVKAKIFEAVQNGSARTAYYFDMSNKVINENGVVNTGHIGGNVGDVNNHVSR